MAPGTVQVDIVSWNRRLAISAKAGHYKKTMELFQQMQQKCMNPDKYTFVQVLNACSGLRAIEEGKRIHLQIIQDGYESDVFVGNCLVDMYAKCGNIEDARSLFNKMPRHDVVSWNTMILAYVKCGQGQKALELSQQMQQEGVDPDSVTFLGLLNACASLASLEEGRRFHQEIIGKGCESDLYVGNTLIDMYASCGSIEDAWRTFNKMPIRDVVSWNALILGHVTCGQGQKALDLSRQMQRERVDPDKVTFIGILNACASVAAVEEGKQAHREVTQRGIECDVYVGNSLIYMYSKCGSIEDAWRVFDKMPERNVVSWAAMLGGYAIHGNVKEALAHFQRMYEEGVDLDEVTFVSLLAACSHGGLVDEGLHYFSFMNAMQRHSPTVEHYTCMVDLLGRAGRLHEADDLIKTMSCEADLQVWTDLLSACNVHGNMEMAEAVEEQVRKLSSRNNQAPVRQANLYASADEWFNANIHGPRSDRHVNKQPERAWIEVNCKLHSFNAEDETSSNEGNPCRAQSIV